MTNPGDGKEETGSIDIPSFYQVVDDYGNLLYMGTEESVKEWFEDILINTTGMRVWIPTHNIFASVWEFHHMYT